VIRRAVGGNRDAVVALSRLERNQPVGHIEYHLCGIALGRVTEAAATRQF
jgi:hypothetical protein